MRELTIVNVGGEEYSVRISNEYKEGGKIITESGYYAQCLNRGLTGAITQGDTKKEVIKNIKEAISGLKEVIKEFGTSSYDRAICAECDGHTSTIMYSHQFPNGMWHAICDDCHDRMRNEKRPETN